MNSLGTIDFNNEMLFEESCCTNCINLYTFWKLGFEVDEMLEFVNDVPKYILLSLFLKIWVKLSPSICLTSDSFIIQQIVMSFIDGKLSWTNGSKLTYPVLSTTMADFLCKNGTKSAQTVWKSCKDVQLMNTISYLFDPGLICDKSW